MLLDPFNLYCAVTIQPQRRIPAFIDFLSVKFFHASFSNLAKDTSPAPYPSTHWPRAPDRRYRDERQG